MTRRIEKISSYITYGEKVIDVGCDSALLSSLLASREIYSIASDLRSNIIENAKKRVDKEKLKYISFRVGNGITLTEEENDYTLVMAGMGAYLMIDILKNTNKRFKKIITISNNNHEMLRREFLHSGYIVDKEEIIKEKGKFYNLIIFKEGELEYTEEELLLGKNHQNIKLFKEKNQMLINKYTKILNNIVDKEKRKDLERTLDILKSSL